MTRAIDPVAAARAQWDAGDLDGAERTLATAALVAGDDRDRAARALVQLCERRGEVSLRAQQALEALVERAGASSRDDVVARARRLLIRDDPGAGGVDPGAQAKTAVDELPSLDGFAAPMLQPITEKAPRMQSLSELADDVFAHHTPGGAADVSDTIRTDEQVPVSLDASRAPPIAAPTPRDKTGQNGQTADVLRAFGVGSVVHERYEVKAHLGRGGHATVLRVFDRELSEDCALKVFHNTGDAADVARFKREVSISRKIVHENVVTLYDIGQESGFYYLTMELLTGEDLASALKRRAVTLGSAIGWLVDACRGLQAAHDKGVVHRDVKPGNLFVLESGRLKVMDFGIAKPADALSLTSTGVFVGTPQFVSPEQVQGKVVGPAADIYSLGVVAYLMLTGTLPFRDKEMVALLMKHATGVPDRPIARNPSLPPALDELVFAMLQKQPAQRPASCAAVAAALDGIRRSLV